VSSDARIAEVIDEDGDTLVISHCESLRAASSPDYATCRWAAGRLGRSFHFGAASPGCHLSASSTVTFNGSDLPSDIGTSICLKKRHSRSKNSARMTLRLPQAQQRGLKLFCFAWTTWKSRDVALLPDVRHAFQQCDGYRIFSDRQPAEEVENLVKVKVPEQDVQPKDEKWLYHRNMAGLMPSWDYLLKEEAEKYDWFVNVEFDHLLLTSKLRVSIATYLSLLEEGNPEQRQDAKGPLMLMFGNAFVFNHLMVKDMKRQWDHLGATAPAGHPASGCPTFMEGRFEWPRACSQDIVYPNLVTFMDPPVPAYGSPGCGQKPQDFPLACFEIQRQPVRDLGLDQISLVQHLATGEVVLADAKEVPLIHHLSDPAARKLARDLLAHRFDVRTSNARIPTTRSQDESASILYCRKVPPQQGLQESSSAPSLR